jgi:hypothetical protein
VNLGDDPDPEAVRRPWSLAVIAGYQWRLARAAHAAGRAVFDSQNRFAFQLALAASSWSLPRFAAQARSNK